MSLNAEFLMLVFSTYIPEKSGNSASEDEDMNSDVEIDEPESEDPDEEYPDMLESEDDEPAPNPPESSLEASAASSPLPKAGPATVPLKPTLRVKLKLGSRPTRLPESTVASSAASVTPEPDIIPGRRSGKRAISAYTNPAFAFYRSYIS